MSFDRDIQPILQNTGNLALSCSEVQIDGGSIGWFTEAAFEVTGDLREVKTGYPLRTTQIDLDTLGATAKVTGEELGGPVKTILAGIINSLNTSVVPTHNLDLEVFRPRATNIQISMTNAALLQQFDLNFSNDFNSVTFDFEQIVPPGVLFDTVVNFAPIGGVTFGAGTPQLDKGNASIGLPMISINGSSIGAIQSASLSLATEYRRLEAGQPKTLFALTPLEHTVILEVASEEFTDAALEALLTLGGSSVVAFTAALYDGTSVVITLPAAQLVPAGTNLAKDEWSTITKKFIATGATLLTIA
jgi:hypothetical protein